MTKDNRDKEQPTTKPAQGDELGDLTEKEQGKDVKGGGAKPWPPVGPDDGE